MLTCPITLTISIIAYPNTYSHTLGEESISGRKLLRFHTLKNLCNLNYRIAKNLNCDAF